MSARKEACLTVASCIAAAILALFVSGNAHVYGPPASSAGIVIAGHGLELYGNPGDPSFFDCNADPGLC